VLTPAELADGAAAAGLELGPDGVPAAPLVLVDLAPAGLGEAGVLTRAAAAAAADRRVLVGVADQPLPAHAEPLLAALTCTLLAVPAADGAAVAPRPVVAVADAAAAVAEVAGSVAAAPLAAVTLVGLLRLTSALPVPDALVAESLAYSMLLAGPEFARWRAARPRRPEAAAAGPAVLLARAGDRLEVTLNRPDRHNAYDRQMRDGLVEALRLAELDPTISRVRLRGRGPSFCSGGDLDEFGTAPGVVPAHLVRLERSAGLLVYRCRDRVRPELHGACIGAGIEIPAFADRVSAAAGAWFRLPELRMGLVPGAGGTVSVTARIGRWRTAYLALTGRRLDLAAALAWGLVDEVAGRAG
jgi:hypothetical protein